MAGSRRASFPKELSGWIDARIHSEFADLVSDFEPALARELQGLQDEYAARIKRILKDVHALAADIFDTDGTGPLPQVGLRARSCFSFKLEDPEHAPDMIVGQLRTLAPDSLGRRLVLADAERHLIEMADRHAGRLRSELHQRVVNTNRAYRGELAGSVERAIGAITRALDHAASQHTWDQTASSTRLTELPGSVERCELIAEKQAAD